MTKILATTIPTALLALVFANAAEAQPPHRFQPPQLTALMASADTNKDGAISRDELAAIDVFAVLDKNQDGKIDSADVDHPFAMHRGAEGGFLLRVADEDKDGKLTRADWQSWIGKADVNGDGLLGRDELRALMPAPPEPPAAPKAPTTPQAPEGVRGARPVRPVAPMPPMAPPPMVPPPMAPPELALEDLAQAFDSFDTNHDGELAGEEMPSSRRMIWHQRHEYSAANSAKSDG